MAAALAPQLLDFLGFPGLVLNVANVRPPSKPHDRYWGDDGLMLEGDNTDRLYTYWRPPNRPPERGPVSLRISGLDLLLEVFNVRIERDGRGRFVPATTQPAGARITLRMGRHRTHTKSRYLVGPVDLQEDADLNQLAFYPDAAYALRIASRREFITGSDAAVPFPLRLGLAPGGFLEVDLDKAHVRLREGVVGAVLGADGGSSPPDMYRSVGVVDFAFRDLAAATRPPARLRFAKQAGSRPAPLHVAERAIGPLGHPPGVEVTDGGFEVTLVTRPRQAPGAQVTDAALVTVDAARPVAARLHGLRNSRNAVEAWSTTDRIPLAFRLPEGAVPPSVLVRPRPPAERSTWRRLTGFDGTLPLPLFSVIPGARFEFDGAAPAGAEMVASIAAAAEQEAGDWCDGDLQYLRSRPWLAFGAGRFVHGRPAEAYRRAAGAETVWSFEAPQGGRHGGAPVLPLGIWSGAGADTADAEIDATFRDFAAGQNGRATHESGLVDATTGAVGIMRAMPDGTGASRLALKHHDRTLRLTAPHPVMRMQAGRQVALPPGDLVASMTVGEGQIAEYAVHWPGVWDEDSPAPVMTGIGQWSELIKGTIDGAVPIYVDRLPDPDDRDFPIAILKTGRRRDLGEILAEIEAAAGSGRARRRDAARRSARSQALLELIGKVDEAILAPTWVGLIVFDLRLGLEDFAALKALVPTTGDEAPGLAFYALYPRAVPGDEVLPAVSAAVDWRNPSTADAPDGPDGQQEATLEPRELRVAFRENALTQFHSKSRLTFVSFMGLTEGASQARRSEVDIIGSARALPTASGKPDYEIRFAAEVSDRNELVIYPLGPWSTAQPPDATHRTSFIRRVALRRVEVVDAPVEKGVRKAEIQIDGSIAFQAPDVGKLDFAFLNALREVKFGNLRIELDGFTGIDPRWLTLKYPSLGFDLDLPHFDLLGDALKLKLHHVLVDWDGTGLQLGRFLPMWDFSGIAVDTPKLAFFGRLDFGSLPDLFRRSLSGFSLEGVFALGLELHQGRFPQYFGLRGLGFEKLNLDLTGFLTLRADELRLEYYPPAATPQAATGSMVSLRNGSLSILGLPVLEGLSGGYFSLDNRGGEGFWALLERPLLGNLFAIEWAFIARNVDLDTDVAKVMLTPPAYNAVVTGSHAGLGDTLSKAWQAGKLRPASADNARGWTFAASLSVMSGAFVGRALLQDGGFKGFALWGDALADLLGYNFALVAIYHQDITPGEDYFYLSVTLPSMTLGTLRYSGGVFAAEVYTSGDYLVDFGFPWPAIGGGRQWERTVGAIVTPGQASGGFYLRRRGRSLDGQGLLTVGAGFALQWGLGLAAGGGVFSVWIRLGVYVIAEGEATLRLESRDSVRVVGLAVKGAAGILLEGEGRINWWVITARVGVRASAEVGVAIVWRDRTLPNPIDPAELRLHAELSVSAYAEACIGGSCYRVCRGISVGLTVPVHHTIRLG